MKIIELNEHIFFISFKLNYILILLNIHIKILNEYYLNKNNLIKFNISFYYNITNKQLKTIKL